jgi:hypothetical protein
MKPVRAPNFPTKNSLLLFWLERLVMVVNSRKEADVPNGNPMIAVNKKGTSGDSKFDRVRNKSTPTIAVMSTCKRVLTS